MPRPGALDRGAQRAGSAPSGRTMSAWPPGPLHQLVAEGGGGEAAGPGRAGQRLQPGRVPARRRWCWSCPRADPCRRRADPGPCPVPERRSGSCRARRAGPAGQRRRGWTSSQTCGSGRMPPLSSRAASPVPFIEARQAAMITSCRSPGTTISRPSSSSRRPPGSPWANTATSLIRRDRSPSCRISGFSWRTRLATRGQVSSGRYAPRRSGGARACSARSTRR